MEQKVTFGYTSDFKRQIKRLMKKYPSLKRDFDTLLDDLTKNPFLGTDLGNGVRKVRMAIASKGKGKSGGARQGKQFVNAVNAKFTKSFFYSVFAHFPHFSAMKFGDIKYI